jgi:hypothetical protein
VRKRLALGIGRPCDRCALVRRTKIPFTGRFTADGDLQITLKRSRKMFGTATLHLDFTADAAVLSARIMAGGVEHLPCPWLRW